jgi:hypothetical protein
MKKSTNQNEDLINVNDIINILSENNFSNQKQIEMLLILNLALHKKNYPEDICGIIERKIKILERIEKENATLYESNLRLSTEKGIKVNFIRIVNNLSDLSFFIDKNGNKTTKKEVFKSFGKLFNQDLSSFHNDLSASKAKAASNNDMRNSTAIFELMLAKQIEINKK